MTDKAATRDSATPEATLLTKLSCIGGVCVSLVAIATIVLLFLAGIDDGDPSEMGFWAGWRHGFLAPFVVFGKALFDSDAVFYVSGNAGWPYDAGFLVGVGVLGSLDRGFDLLGKLGKLWK